MTYRHSIGSTLFFLISFITSLTFIKSAASAKLETIYDASTGLIRKGLAQLFGWNSIAHSWIKSKKPNRSLLVFQYSWTEHPFGVELGRKLEGNIGFETNAPHQANYYKESGEHRCVQHGIALTFCPCWLVVPTTRRTANSTRHPGAFAKEFWDKERWTTVSQSQGGGLFSVLQPARQSDGRGLERLPYFRAVDQAPLSWRVYYQNVR
jgi:hypothetical protein